VPILSKDEKTVSLQMIEAGYPFVSFHKKKENPWLDQGFS